MDVEQRARAILAAQYSDDPTMQKKINDGTCRNEELVRAERAIIAALTPPEGSDQGLLELAAMFETCIPFLPSAGQRNIGKAVAQLRQMAIGYVLVPVEPTEEMVLAAEEAHMPFGDMGFAISAAIGARPNVPDGRG